MLLFPAKNFFLASSETGEAHTRAQTARIWLIQTNRGYSELIVTGAGGIRWVYCANPHLVKGVQNLEQ